MVKIFKRVFSQYRLNILKNEAGAVILLYALAIVPIFGMLGIAIDTGRAFYVHSIISGAVDQASIAGATVAGNQQNVINKATSIFNANIPSNFLATIIGPTISVSSDGNTISVAATGHLETTFMKLLGKDTIDVSASSAALRVIKGLEVVLALDNTGSMAGSPMQAELDAAQNLVDILYGGKTTVQGLWVGLVPYTTTVNIGMAGMATPHPWLTAAGVAQTLNPLLYPNIAPTATSVGGRWMGCIEARTPPIYAAGLDTSNTPPTTDGTRFTPFLYPSTLVHKYVQGVALDRVNPLNGSDPIPGTGDNDWTLAGGAPAGRFFGNNWFQDNNGVGPNLGCPIPMLPLTDNIAPVKAQIALMKATFRGGTMVPIGLQAAWWMLSPSWRGMWPTSNAGLPQDFTQTNKAIILMTDGENQWYDWPTGGPNFAADADYNGYGRIAEGRLGAGIVSNAASRPILNARTTTMCNAIKNEGIVIYTIIFDHGTVPAGSPLEAVFRNCASDPAKYFRAVSNAELIATFGTIANSLNNLRLRWPGQP